MKKTIQFSLLIILFSLCSNAQNNDKYLGKVFLRNGQVHTLGYEYVQPNNPSKCMKIKYRTADNLQFVQDCKEIIKVRRFELDSIGNAKDSIDYDYKYYKNGFKLIEKLESRGKVHLYVEHVASGAASFGSVSMKAVYYIGKQYSTKIEKLHHRKTSKKFKEILRKYFPNCATLEEKINDKKFFKKNAVIKILQYFNENCN